MTRELCYLWLGMADKLSNTVKRRLIEIFGSVEAVWDANPKDLQKILNEKQLQILLDNHDQAQVEEYNRRLKAQGVSVLYDGHLQYPEKLSYIPDAPVTLFTKGKISLLTEQNTKGLAIVGSRNVSLYGKQMVYELVQVLLEYKITIISGMALGVDGLVHQETVRGNGNAVAVLGSGINIPYPRENLRLYQALCDGGLVLSEYGLDVRPDAWHFPLRNRIISGLSDAVLVIEAREKSGSLITADQALEQGRDVFAIPGRIHDRNSAGCNNLIKTGAACITSANDIIDLMRLQKKKEMVTCKKEENKILLAPKEKMVYSCVRLESRHVDEICNELDLRVPDILGVLFDLEKRGLIKQPVRNHYVRC